MSWLINITFWLAAYSAQLLFAYALYPLIKFALGFLCYSLAATFLAFLAKLRYEVFNEDLKLKPNEIKTRVLLITGAGSGIGFELVRYFLKRGFVIVACYYSKGEPGYEKLVGFTESQENLKRLHLVELDVRSQESIAACYANVKKILADEPTLKLHALLNVAGVGMFHKFQWTPREAIRNMIETNVTGPMLLTRQFLHLLVKTPLARVVNVSSPLGILPFTFGSVYGPSKAAVAHFSGCLESDCAKYNLRVVTIQPGNLIRHTAIFSASLKNEVLILDELNEEELALYESDIARHEKMADVLLRAHRRTKPFKDLRTVRKFTRILEGDLVEHKLQESVSFFKSYENSVCLRDPPREMFSGNMFFNLIISSLFQWFPRFMYREMTLNLKNTLQWCTNLK